MVPGRCDWPGMDLSMMEPMPALLDGALPLQRTEIAGWLRERALLAARWFVPIQRGDGSFPYTYDPVADRYDFDAYNEVRHAGATYALFQACGLFDDAALRECGRRAAEWVLHSSVSTPSGGAAYLYQGRCKLGGLALAIVALLEGRHALGETGWDEAIGALGQFLLEMELPGEPGRYFQSFEVAGAGKRPQDERAAAPSATTAGGFHAVLASSKFAQGMLLTPDSHYYPGEALLALARLHGAFPDGPWLAAAQRAAHYLIHIKDGDQVAARAVPRDDHWLAIALSELARADPNPDFAMVAFLQAERMVGSQCQAGDAEAWRIGSDRRKPTPSFASIATQAEALDAAWELARLLQDDGRAERYSVAALRAAQFLMRVQYTGERAAGFPHPERAVGGWAQDIAHAQIRIDFVQHGLSALIGAERLLGMERSVRRTGV